MPSDEQLTLLIVRLELFTVEQTTFTKNEWNLSIHHKSRYQLHKVYVSCLECLCLLLGKAGTTTNLRCFEYPKKSLLKSSHPKKYLPNFQPKKIPELKISNPKISFEHPCHLKSRDPPTSASLSYRVLTWWTNICYQIAALLSQDTY